VCGFGYLGVFPKIPQYNDHLFEQVEQVSYIHLKKRTVRGDGISTDSKCSDSRFDANNSIVRTRKNWLNGLYADAV
jgi:hypothetical protein